MLPDAHSFAVQMTALGLGDGMRFVIYDTHGLFAVLFAGIEFQKLLSASAAVPAKQNAPAAKPVADEAGAHRAGDAAQYNKPEHRFAPIFQHVYPVAPEKCQQRRERSHMQGDIERRPQVLPPGHPRDDNQMGRTAYREKFRVPLNYAKHCCLYYLRHHNDPPFNS